MLLPKSGLATRGVKPRSTQIMQAATRVRQWQRGAVDGNAEWLLLTGAARSGKSHLAVGALRTIKQEHERVTIGYADAELCLNDLRLFLGDRELPDPLHTVRIGTICVIDSFASIIPTYFVNEITVLLNERWAEKKPTMLVSRCSLEELQQKYTRVAALSSISVCETT